MKEQNPFHRNIAIWGASRISRRRAGLLQEQGIIIDSYIDTKPSRQLDKEVLNYKDLPESGSMVILTYIRQMDNREKIRTFLEKRGYVEGRDYLLVS